MKNEMVLAHSFFLGRGSHRVYDMGIQLVPER